MAKKPENSPEKPNFILDALAKYGRYFVLPGCMIPDLPMSDYKTISIWEQLELISKEESAAQPERQHKSQVVNGEPSEAWHLRRVEPRKPIDFLEYHRRKN
jgi:hypothetical protein